MSYNDKLRSPTKSQSIKKSIHVTNRDGENLLGGENHDTSCVETEERDFVLIPTGQHLEVCNLQYPFLF